MTLAARCPSCRTAFRVVQDQLKVSNGWVRCGRCAAVFNATETLFELDAPTPPIPPAPPPPAAPTPVVVVPGTPITAAGGLATATVAPAPDVDAGIAFDRGWDEPVKTPQLSVDELHAALFGPMPVSADGAPINDVQVGGPLDQEQALEPPVEPPVEPVAEEPVEEPLAETAAECVAAQPVAWPAAEPIAESGAEHAAEPVAQPVLEPFGESVAEPFPEPIAGPLPEPRAEPLAEPIDDAFPAPIAEPIGAVSAEPEFAAEPWVQRTDDGRGAEAATGPAPSGEVAATGDLEAAVGPTASDEDSGAAPDRAAVDLAAGEPVGEAAASQTLAATRGDDAVAAEPASAEAAADDTSTPTSSATEPTEAPAFVREAERAARWRAPEVRAALAAAAFLLSGAAVLQGTRAFHEPIGRQWPAARTWLEPLCRMAGCDEGPRRRIDGLTVESSSLVKVDETGHAMRLSLVLRNRDRQPLVLPAIELTLTDVYGGIVARKVFQPRELGARVTSLGAGAELALQAVLDTGEPRVVGYTIEIFYP